MRTLCWACTVLGLALRAFAGPDEVSDGMSHMIEKTTNLRTHSLAPPYVDSDLQNRWWDFGADAIINTNKHVRLTQDKPSQTGWLWSRMPISLINWQVEIEFAVDGKAQNVFGDGFAVWITKERAEVGPVFGGRDYFNGLGIFFDTYANSRHSYSWPRVSAMLGDGFQKYDHDHDNEQHEIAGCSENFRRRDFTTKAKITYLKNELLQLSLQTRNSDEWTVCFEIEARLPDQPYLGFSALTGDVSDNHDIVRVDTFSVTLKPEYRAMGSGKSPQPVAANENQAQQPLLGNNRNGQRIDTKQTKRKNKGSSGGAAGVFLFILKAIGVLAFVAFAFAAVRTYNAQQKSKRTW